MTPQNSKHLPLVVGQFVELNGPAWGTDAGTIARVSGISETDLVSGARLDGSPLPYHLGAANYVYQTALKVTPLPYTHSALEIGDVVQLTGEAWDDLRDAVATVTRFSRRGGAYATTTDGQREPLVGYAWQPFTAGLAVKLRPNGMAAAADLTDSLAELHTAAQALAAAKASAIDAMVSGRASLTPKEARRMANVIVSRHLSAPPKEGPNG